MRFLSTRTPTSLFEHLPMSHLDPCAVCMPPCLFALGIAPSSSLFGTAQPQCVDLRHTTVSGLTGMMAVCLVLSQVEAAPASFLCRLRWGGGECEVENVNLSASGGCWHKVGRRTLWFKHGVCSVEELAIG